MKTKLNNNSVYIIEPNNESFYTFNSDNIIPMIEFYTNELDIISAGDYYDVELKKKLNDNELLYIYKEKNQFREQGFQTNEITIIELEQYGNNSIKKYNDIDKLIYFVIDEDLNKYYNYYTTDKNDTLKMFKDFLKKENIVYDEIEQSFEDNSILEYTITKYYYNYDLDGFIDHESAYQDHFTKEFYIEKIPNYEEAYRKAMTKKKSNEFNL